MKPYTPLENIQTNTQCNCCEKTEKYIGKRIGKNETKDAMRNEIITTETNENVSGAIDRVSNSTNVTNSNTAVSNQNVPMPIEKRTGDSASNLSFVSKHLDNVSGIIENVSESIENVSESIDYVSEAINSLDSDLANTLELNTLENHIEDEVLSVNLKNLEISDNYSDMQQNDSDKCTCGYNYGRKDSEIASVDLSNSIALINR